MAPHQLFELRTSRQALQTPETAVQLFATLPLLKNHWWHRLLGKDETASFEIIVQNQTVYFLVYAPARLGEYLQGLLQASYPEIMITPLNVDPLAELWQRLQQPVLGGTPQLKLAAGSLMLKNVEYLPLKDYHDFSDIDPLAPILSTLAKSQADEVVHIQMVVSPSVERWKRAGQSLLDTTPTHAQATLIKKKLERRAIKVALRLAAASTDQVRSQHILETMAAAYQSISQSDGNYLTLRKPLFFKQAWLHAWRHRRLSLFGNYHLSLEEVATLYHLPHEKLKHIPNIAWGKHLLGEAPENLPIVSKETPPEIKKDINPFARALYKNVASVYGLKRADRRKHLYVIGKTGTGKSTLLANMAINDLKNNEGMCVIDPHGDLVETLLDYIPSHRINDVVYFNPADVERTVKINLFEGENVAHRELIASGIVSIFQKLYSYSWGPRLEYILRNALLTLLATRTSRMSDITQLLTDKDFRREVVSELEDPVLKSFWLNEFEQMQPRQQTEAIAPILNKVGQFVSSPLIRNVVNASKSSFSIDEIMNEGKIMLVNLSQGRLGEDNATLLGAMLITKIQLSAMGRVDIPEEERRDFFLYVDEFQNFATQSFNKILSEARKYRLNLTLANQYVAQIPEEVQKAIFGNCGSMISFIMGSDDARVFAKEYGNQYTEDDLVSLGRYQIINRLSIDDITSKPFPAHTLMLATSTNSNREKVIKVSRERYAGKK
jgi:hypothetical protein